MFIILVRQYLYPSLLISLGASLLGFGISSGQGTAFILGGLAILFAGIFSLVSMIAPGSPALRWGVVVIFAGVSVGLGASSYKTIKEDIDFQNEWEFRKTHIVQNLVDIRSAQLAYKNVNGQFTPSFDSLLTFIKNDSFTVVKAIGTVPDTLSEQEAVELGIVQRDTFMVSVRDSVFSISSFKKRKDIPFILDSLPYVPFTGAPFVMDAGLLDKGNLQVPVFEAKDTASFNPDHMLQVGSMTEANTNGNWE